MARVRVRLRRAAASCSRWFGAIDVPLLGTLLLGSLPGILIGSSVASRVPDEVLRPVLAATLLVVGGRLLL